jgi:exopolyphosphatase/guanosine-5'-triphosphate,3'-diphosphate pyrophosphatase
MKQKSKSKKKRVKTRPVPSPDLRAVIDIGSTSIRMVIAEITDGTVIKPVESLQQTVNLGHDTFTTGLISDVTIEQCVEVLRSFGEILREYHITSRDAIRAVATSAVREARNHETFIDRVFIATGIDVHPIDGTEVNRLTYFSVLPLFKKYPAFRKGNLLVVEVGGGSTELIGMNNAHVAFAHTYRLGAFRIREFLSDLNTSDAQLRDLMETEISSTVRLIKETPVKKRDIHMLFLGGEARFAAAQLIDTWDGISPARVRVAMLAQLAEKVLNLSIDDVVRKYHMPFSDAEMLGPALLAQVRLAQAMRLKTVYMGTPTLRDGLLAEIAAGSAWRSDYVEQLVSSAIEIGKKYHFDQAHAEAVTHAAIKLFKALQDEHKLSLHYEAILRVAGLLHDVGTFISTRSHHKHSLYLIRNSDIFGLSEHDLTLVALVARYHRKALPGQSHLDYNKLDRNSKLTVCKLAAILRVADALDRSHTQQCTDPVITVTPDTLELSVRGPANIAINQIALEDKGVYFNQIYGKRIVFRTQ